MGLVQDHILLRISNNMMTFRSYRVTPSIVGIQFFLLQKISKEKFHCSLASSLEVKMTRETPEVRSDKRRRKRKGRKRGKREEREEREER